MLPSGASTLARHGAGTQSLSVLFLFQAYLSAMLEQQYSELGSPASGTRRAGSPSASICYEESLVNS